MNTSDQNSQDYDEYAKLMNTMSFRAGITPSTANTGSMQAPTKKAAKKEMDLESIFDFGKHRGKQLEDVIEDFPRYIEWLVEADFVDFDEETLEVLANKGIA